MKEIGKTILHGKGKIVYANGDMVTVNGLMIKKVMEN